MPRSPRSAKLPIVEPPPPRRDDLSAEDLTRHLMAAILAAPHVPKLDLEAAAESGKLGSNDTAKVLAVMAPMLDLVGTYYFHRTSRG